MGGTRALPMAHSTLGLLSAETNKNLLKICVKQAFSLIDTPSCRSIRVFPAVVCYGSLKRTNHRLVIAQAAMRLLWEHLKI